MNPSLVEQMAKTAREAILDEIALVDAEIQRLALEAVAKGDVAGHEFHGNQWTDDPGPGEEGHVKTDKEGNKYVTDSEGTRYPYDPSYDDYLPRLTNKEAEQLFQRIKDQNKKDFKDAQRQFGRRKLGPFENAERKLTRSVVLATKALEQGDDEIAKMIYDEIDRVMHDASLLLLRRASI